MGASDPRFRQNGPDTGSLLSLPWMYALFEESDYWRYRRLLGVLDPDAGGSCPGYWA